MTSCEQLMLNVEIYCLRNNVTGILKSKLYLASCNIWQLLLVLDLTQHKTKVNGSVHCAKLYQAITKNALRDKYSNFPTDMSGI